MVHVPPLESAVHVLRLCRRVVPGGALTRRLRLLTVMVAIVSIAVATALGSGGASPRRVRPSATAERIAADAVPGTVAQTGDGSTDAGADVAAAGSREHVVHTMSMDASIQGGLSAHQEQAISTRMLGTHRDAAVAPAASSWTAAMGRSAVARAASWIGMPYSWAGGTSTGPSTGRCAPQTGGDLDCHVVGFDCSGLTTYAWGPYALLAHQAAEQLSAGGFHPTLAQLLPGDLVFFSGYLPDGTGHVAIYAGHGTVIEAPQSGAVIRRAPLSELLAGDGTYRGAVRPLTGTTPALAAPRGSVSTAGGLLTLRGTNLAGVDAVRVGHDAVRQFVTHTDSVIVLRVPSHRHGTVALTVSTSWRAASGAVTLSYVRPKHATAPTSPSSSADPTQPLTLAPPSSSSPSSSPSPTGSASKIGLP